MDLRSAIIETLKKEVIPAMGCTEPVAVSLACAKAKEIGGYDIIDRVQILVSPNIFKNGLGVGVPNTEEVGLYIAGALGIVGGRSEKSLEIFEDIRDYHLRKAHELLESSKLKLSIKDTPEKIYIEVIVNSGPSYTKVIIQQKHNKFVYIEKNGEVLLNIKSDNEEKDNSSNIIYKSRIKDCIKEIEKMNHKDISFLMEGIKMNENIALKALDKKLGLGAGYGIRDAISKGTLSNDLMNNAMMMTAAGADARMSGINMPVMSSNGSGNNGLTAILPIAVYRSKFNETDERIAKALAISHIINCYIKKHIGRLSALCGCGVAAATGASAGITWLMGGSYDNIDGAIKNMIANISGMICDGAKGSCALKVATAASVAVQSAILARNNLITLSKKGIIADTAEETIVNLGILSNEGMKATDTIILDIMKKMA